MLASSVRRTISTGSLIVGINTSTLKLAGGGDACLTERRQVMNRCSSVVIIPHASAAYITQENTRALGLRLLSRQVRYHAATSRKTVTSNCRGRSSSSFGTGTLSHFEAF